MRVFIDCDPGIDDALALAYLTADSGVELVGVGTVFGNNSVDITTDNALRLLELYGRPEVPVARGAERPLVQEPSLAESVHGANGLGDVELPAPAGSPVEESAAELLVRLARENPGGIDLLAVGPLTNIALALALEPRLPSLLRKVVVMGGAVQEPGNVTPWAEANTSNDPEAAERVFAAGFDLDLVALDVTMKTVAPGEWLDELKTLAGERAGKTAAFLDFYYGWYSSVFGVRQSAMHDPLAAGILLDRSLVTRSVDRPVMVELKGEYTRGLTIADLRPFSTAEGAERPLVTLVQEVDGDAFLKRMMDALR
ncbi:nucleoside hydrolase [Nocardiopsis sp. CNT-189]|uniref:nucleoside hydrolase n=1 Tax=Nocardiopsis oceanisediminis TaxID=2816862 RepID=UPI003B320C2B